MPKHQPWPASGRNPASGQYQSPTGSNYVIGPDGKCHVVREPVQFITAQSPERRDRWTGRLIRDDAQPAALDAALDAEIARLTAPPAVRHAELTGRLFSRTATHDDVLELSADRDYSATAMELANRHSAGQLADANDRKAAILDEWSRTTGLATSGSAPDPEPTTGPAIVDIVNGVLGEEWGLEDFELARELDATVVDLSSSTATARGADTAGGRLHDSGHLVDHGLGRHDAYPHPACRPCNFDPVAFVNADLARLGGAR
jgi:hypothetical protein